MLSFRVHVLHDLCPVARRAQAPIHALDHVHRDMAHLLPYREQRDWCSPIECLEASRAIGDAKRLRSDSFPDIRSRCRRCDWPMELSPELLLDTGRTVSGKQQSPTDPWRTREVGLQLRRQLRPERNRTLDSALERASSVLAEVDDTALEVHVLDLHAEH